MKISDLRSQIAERLSGVSDTADLDARVLLAHILNKPRAWLEAHPEAQITQSQITRIEKSISRLLIGEPLPYVVGSWEFFGLEFKVTTDVLIPRPETELLVERALKWLRASPERRNVADVGTGSGCIAVILAMQLPDVLVTGTDISYPALKIASQNARKYRVSKRINFVECDLLPPRTGRLPTDLHFDLICANLPYIPTQTLEKLPIYGREPTLALDGGIDGLDVIRRLLDKAPEWLASRGMLMLEIEANQGLSALSLAYDRFADAMISLHKDLAGRDRLLQIELL